MNNISYLYFKKEMNNFDYKQIKNQNNTKFHWLNFFEIGNFEDIHMFIESCHKFPDIKYNTEKIKKIMSKNKYISYILYENDKPLGFIIGKIKIKNNEKRILKINTIGILNDIVNINKKLFINGILNKAQQRNIDTIIIKAPNNKNPFDDTLKENNFIIIKKEN